MTGKSISLQLGRWDIVFDFNVTMVTKHITRSYAFIYERFPRRAVTKYEQQKNQKSEVSI